MVDFELVVFVRFHDRIQIQYNRTGFLCRGSELIEQRVVGGGAFIAVRHRFGIDQTLIRYDHVNELCIKVCAELYLILNGACHLFLLILTQQVRAHPVIELLNEMPLEIVTHQRGINTVVGEVDASVIGNLYRQRNGHCAVQFLSDFEQAFALIFDLYLDQPGVIIGTENVILDTALDVDFRTDSAGTAENDAVRSTV